MEEVGGASEAKEEDGGGAGGDDDENEGQSTSKAADTPETQPSMDRGLAMILTVVPPGWRRSAEPQRPRRRTVAAVRTETVEMKAIWMMSIGDGDPRDGGKMSDVLHIWWRGGRNTTCWHNFRGGKNSR
jgi:hypothetical protein